MPTSERVPGRPSAHAHQRWSGRLDRCGLMDITIDSRFSGPPGIGHGGYVAGHFAAAVLTNGDRRAAVTGSDLEPVQVTLRSPTPLDVPLDLVASQDEHDLERRWELRHGDRICADAIPSALELDVPRPPSLDGARGAESGSPSHYDGRGVHPTCFGCSILRGSDDGLRIAAGPIDVGRRAMVAASWTPSPAFAGAGGCVDVRHVVAALDCPGAFAFMVDGERPGLLGRITYEIRSPVAVGEPHVVTGWQVGSDGRKLFAGTAIHRIDGTCCAAARSTWFVVDWSQVRSAGKAS